MDSDPLPLLLCPVVNVNSENCRRLRRMLCEFGESSASRPRTQDTGDRHVGVALSGASRTTSTTWRTPLRMDIGHQVCTTNKDVTDIGY